VTEKLNIFLVVTESHPQVFTNFGPLIYVEQLTLIYIIANLPKLVNTCGYKLPTNGLIVT